MTRRLDLGLGLLLLGLAAVGSALLSATWLTVRIGGFAAPVTILFALGYGLWLVSLAGAWSKSTAVAVFPSLVFVLTIVCLDLGPGGSMPVPLDLRGLGLVLAGGVIPFWAALAGGFMVPAGAARHP